MPCTCASRRPRTSRLAMTKGVNYPQGPARVGRRDRRRRRPRAPRGAAGRVRRGSLSPEPAAAPARARRAAAARMTIDTDAQRARASWTRCSRATPSARWLGVELVEARAGRIARCRMTRARRHGERLRCRRMAASCSRSPTARWPSRATPAARDVTGRAWTTRISYSRRAVRRRATSSIARRASRRPSRNQDWRHYRSDRVARQDGTTASRLVPRHRRTRTAQQHPPRDPWIHDCRRIHRRRRPHRRRQHRRPAERRARRRPGGARDRRARSRGIPSLDPARIADVILGCANQAGEDNRNVARMALLLAGLAGHACPGETVNRLCASGMSAVAHAARARRSSARATSTSPAASRA